MFLLSCPIAFGNEIERWLRKEGQVVAVAQQEPVKVGTGQGAAVGIRSNRLVPHISSEWILKSQAGVRSHETPASMLTRENNKILAKY